MIRFSMYANEAGWNITRSLVVRRHGQGFALHEHGTLVDVMGRDPMVGVERLGTFATGEELYALAGIPDEDIPGTLAMLDPDLARGYIRAAADSDWHFDTNLAEREIQEALDDADDDA